MLIFILITLIGFLLFYRFFLQQSGSAPAPSIPSDLQFSERQSLIGLIKGKLAGHEPSERQNLIEQAMEKLAGTSPTERQHLMELAKKKLASDPQILSELEGRKSVVQKAEKYLDQ